MLGFPAKFEKRTVGKDNTPVGEGTFKVPRSYEELIDEAYEALEQSRFDEALEYGRQAINSAPQGAPGHYLAGAALVEMRHFEEAIPCLRTAIEIDPNYPDARFCLASAHFSTCHFVAARHELNRILEAEPQMADAHYWMGLCQERDGRLQEADLSFTRAFELDPKRFRRPCRLARPRFLQVIEDSMALLPPYFRRCLEEMDMTVEDLPSVDLLFRFDPPLDPELFGLFIGTPVLEKALMDHPPPLQDRIFLFQRNLERFSSSQGHLQNEIRLTLVHEVGHAMGLDDEGLTRLGYD
ncbi:MAG: metallopeptidase family protein [Acidobacteriota bacterium]